MGIDNVEEMCKQAQADVKQFQLRAEAEKEMVKKDADIEAKLFSKPFRKEKVERMEVKDETPPEEKFPDAGTRNVLRYTTSRKQVCRFIKIGCALVLDAVGAYA